MCTPINSISVEEKMTTSILTTEILNELAQGLRIVHDGPLVPKPGQRIGVRLESMSGLLSAPDVHDIKLDGTGPDVLKSGLTTVTGKLPMIVQVPVRVDVEWKVFLTPGSTKKQEIELKEGTDFEIIPASPKHFGIIKAPEVSFLFHPRPVEPTADQIVPRPVAAKITARVRLTAKKANDPNDATAEVKFPEPNQPPFELQLPILLPVIPLPTVLALFRHANFLPRDTNLRNRSNFIDTPDGFVLLVVPENSPLKALTHLFDVLNTVEELGSLVGSLVPAQARLLLGLQKLAAAVGTQPHIKFRAVNELNNLNAVVMIQRDLTHNDIEVEDEVSSLILIGPPETKVSLFNNQDLVSNDGQLDVEIGGAGVVILRDLHTAGEPVSETGGTVNRAKNSTKRDGFGQAISSLKFVRQGGSGQPSKFPRVEDVPLKTAVGRRG
jgi:hypothetical protein